MPRSSLRAYSSKGDDKNGDKPIGRPVGATPVLQPRSGPIRINETPRAAAGSKLRSVNNHGWNEDSSKHYPPGSRHPAHALIYGDTPQDPHPTPFQLAHYGEESLYTLILLRHGESEWNNENRYTGWCDVSLTDKGKLEARAAGRLLYENGIEIDHAFTSVLKRASFSCNMALNTAQQHWVPITKTWRLNERHYGALQGYNKDTAYEELNLDQELVMQMRRAYDVQPPRMGDDHPFWHGNDRRYRKLTAEQLERSRAESLKDTAERIMPFWKSVIVPSIRAGNKCLIVSHANTIRTLVKHIDQISDEDIKGMTIPTGIPLLYRLDKDLRPVDPQIEMEFRYLVEPKGYVPLSCGYFPCRLQVVLTLGPCGLLPILLFFFVKIGIPGERPGRTGSTAYTWGIWNGCKTFKANVTNPIAIGNASSCATLANRWDGTWIRMQTISRLVRKVHWSWKRDKSGGTCTPKWRIPITGICCSWRKWRIGWRKSCSNVDKSSSPRARTRKWYAGCGRKAEDEAVERSIVAGISPLLVQITKVHLDAEGHVVEPFVKLAERQDREERQKVFYEQLALDLEEECLIK